MDLLYCSFNRLSMVFQNLASLVQNTAWDRIDRVVVYEDGSTDGTKELVTAWCEQLRAHVPVILRHTHLGGPIAIMLDYLAKDAADVFIKMDSDVIVPAGWLEQCLTVMQAEPHLDFLGIEPPYSRTPSPKRLQRYTTRLPIPAAETQVGPPRSVPCQHIGGIGVMKRSAFEKHPGMQAYGIYGGFTNWQIRNKHLKKGWIAPALKLFLLDRIPEPRWQVLSKQYEAAGWQRSWTQYDPRHKENLWGWWTPVEEESIPHAST